MTPNPPTAAEWAKKCNLDYQAGMNVEGKSWGHLRHGLCEHCANLFAESYARQQVEAFRERVITWLDNEDKDGDPDDLYTGRVHRVAAIREEGRYARP